MPAIQNPPNHPSISPRAFRPVVLTDSPPVVRLKREFSRLAERAELLREWIELRHGDVPEHYAERERIAARKTEIAGEIQNLKRFQR